MASKLKIKVNGLVHNVTASLDTPLLYVLHNELHLHGPALRLRSGAVRCVLGAAGRQGDPLVRDAGRRGERQGDHDARGHAARCTRSRAARRPRGRPRCIRCSRPGSTCRCRTAATARTG